MFASRLSSHLRNSACLFASQAVPGLFYVVVVLCVFLCFFFWVFFFFFFFFSFYLCYLRRLISFYAMCGDFFCRAPEINGLTMRMVVARCEVEVTRVNFKVIMVIVWNVSKRADGTFYGTARMAISIFTMTISGGTDRPNQDDGCWWGQIWSPSKLVSIFAFPYLICGMTTNKMTYAPSEDSDQPRHQPSLISLRCALNGQLTVSRESMHVHLAVVNRSGRLSMSRRPASHDFYSDDWA